MSDSFSADSQPTDPFHFSRGFSDGPRFSVNQITTHRWSFEDAVNRYQRAGIDAIGVWLPSLMEFGEERAEVLLRERGLSVSSISYAGGFTGAFGYQLDDVLRETRDLIRLAGQLHAQSLVVVTGPKRNHLSKHALRLVVSSLKQLADEAAENDVVLSLQPMRSAFCLDWTFLHTLDQTLDVLSRVNHDNVKLAFDTYQLGREPGLLNRLPELVPHIGIVQVSDGLNSANTEYERVLPGEGDLRVAAIVNGLVEAGYRGYFDYQIWSESLWHAADASILQRCRESFQRLCPVIR